MYMYVHVYEEPLMNADIYTVNRLYCKWNMDRYNPPIDFFALSLAEMHHVIQNRRTGIRRYTPSDLIFIFRFCLHFGKQNKQFENLTLNFRFDGK